MRPIAPDVHQGNIATAMLDFSTQNRRLPARRYGLEEDLLADFTGHLRKEELVAMAATFN